MTTTPPTAETTPANPTNNPNGASRIRVWITKDKRFDGCEECGGMFVGQPPEKVTFVATGNEEYRIGEGGDCISSDVDLGCLGIELPSGECREYEIELRPVGPSPKADRFPKDPHCPRGPSPLAAAAPSYFDAMAFHREIGRRYRQEGISILSFVTRPVETARAIARIEEETRAKFGMPKSPA